MIKEESKNTLIHGVEDNPYTAKFKIDVLGIIKGMSEEEQNQLVDWFIEMICKRSSINISNDEIITDFKGLKQVILAKDNVQCEIIKED